MILKSVRHVIVSLGVMSTFQIAVYFVIYVCIQNVLKFNNIEGLLYTLSSLSTNQLLNGCTYRQLRCLNRKLHYQYHLYIYYSIFITVQSDPISDQNQSVLIRTIFSKPQRQYHYSSQELTHFHCFQPAMKNR